MMVGPALAGNGIGIGESQPGDLSVGVKGTGRKLTVFIDCIRGGVGMRGRGLDEGFGT